MAPRRNVARLAIAAIAAWALLLTPRSSESQTIKRTVAPGVELTQEAVAPPTGPLLVNVLRINLKQPGVRVRAELGQDVVLADDPTNGREAVGSVALRHRAVAAINADFFPYTGDPVNLTIRDGELLSESLPHRVAMAITRNGRVRFETLITVGSLMGADGSVCSLDGINRLTGKDEIVVLTPSFGAWTRAVPSTLCVPVNGVNLPVRIGQDQTGTASDTIPGDPKASLPAAGVVLVGDGKGADWLRGHVKPGESTRFRFDCISNPLPTGPYRKEFASRAASFRGRAIKSVWTDVEQAVGGGPWLVRNGKAAVDGQAENMDEVHFVAARHPRSAAGVTASGELLLVTVDGRQEGLSRGMSLPELADYLVKLGALEAINLDGGGSTAMVVKGAYINSPSDGMPRPVASTLLVFSPQAESTPQIETRDPLTFQAGTRLALTNGQSGAAGGGIPADSTGIWGSLEGKAFVSQAGVLTSNQAGNGTALAFLDGKTVRVPYTVLPGPAARVRASLGAVANNPPDRNMLTATVTDAYGNPISGQPIHVQVTGGTAEKTDAVTDAGGRVSMEVVWDVERGRRVIISSGALNPMTIAVKQSDR